MERDVALREVANARREQMRIAMDLCAIQADLDASPLGQALFASRAEKKIADAHVTQLEAQAREAVARAYDGETKKGNGWAIKDMPHVEYDPVKAKAWAIQYLPDALKLDASLFIKAAKLLPSAPAEVFTVPTGFLDSDLSQWED